MSQSVLASSPKDQNLTDNSLKIFTRQAVHTNVSLNKKRYGLKSMSDGRLYIITPSSVINMICAWS